MMQHAETRECREEVQSLMSADNSSQTKPATKPATCSGSVPEVPEKSSKSSGRKEGQPCVLYTRFFESKGPGSPIWTPLQPVVAPTPPTFSSHLREVTLSDVAWTPIRSSPSSSAGLDGHVDRTVEGGPRAP